jgi:4-amino-4-deoxy-L-arabinose transferase-like glycosyltransferase
LDQVPISLFGDEIDVGYHALSLWTTGRDYMGNYLPGYIQSLSEYRAPLLMYLSAPAVGLLGPSTFSVRLVPAIFGILGVVTIYWFSLVLFSQSKKSVSLIAGFAALLLAGSFWHLHYSRAAFEVSLLLFLLLVGFTGLVGYLKTGISRYLWLLPALALSFYTYSTAAVFVPLLGAATLLIYSKQIKLNSKIIAPLLLTAIIMLPISYQIVFGQAGGRFELISIFADKEVTESVEVSRTLPWINPQLDRVFHNRPLELADRFRDNYLSAFSSTFLFVAGDPEPRHSVSGFGQLPTVFAPLILLGLLWLGRNWNRSGMFLLSWLFLSPVPSALTINGATHATRLFIMIPPLVILAALGALAIKDWFSGKLALVLTLVWLACFAWQLSSYWYQYSFHYRFESARAWHFGYQTVLSQVPKYSSLYRQAFINNSHEPSLLRFAFYSQVPPKLFQEEFKGDQVEENLLPGFNGFEYGNRYYFGRAHTLEDWLTLFEPGNLGLVIQGEEVPGDWDWSDSPPEGIKVLELANDIYGKPYMYLVTRE